VTPHPPPLSFQLTARCGAARRGLLVTPHGVVETPAFMPVATYGAVRGLDAEDLVSLGAQIALTNTFHLHERPGEEVIARAGGLHGFTGWRGPWLTDSGGYQVTSLADRASIDEEGVTFASPLDGRRRLLSPESAVRIQEALGSDIAMVLDECLPMEPGEQLRAESALDRSLRWAERALAARARPAQALFGIVQGGSIPALRRRGARALAALPFDGYAHGGLGLGEAAAARLELVAEAQAELPATAPRYLMGLGKPEDLIGAIAEGVDLFDCVIPTRHARHGLLYSAQGTLAIRNARYREDFAPVDADCDCRACRVGSRAYLRHLFAAGEALGPRLATLHNLRFYLRLMARARAAITAGTLPALRREVDEHAGRRAT
jgi:queuine tRNA-ribosyltransferase